MSPEALGRAVGMALFVALATAVPVVWAFRLRRRGSRSWWVPILVGGILLVGLAGSVGTRQLDGEGERVDAAALLSRVGGYTLSPLAPEAAAQVEAPFRRDPAMAEDIEGIESRSASAPDGTEVGAVVVIAVDPEVTSDPSQEEGFARGLSESSGSPPEPLEIGGEGVFEVRSEAQGLIFVAWVHRNLFVLVVGAETEAVRSLAGAVVAASRG